MTRQAYLVLEYCTNYNTFLTTLPKILVTRWKGVESGVGTEIAILNYNKYWYYQKFR